MPTNNVPHLALPESRQHAASVLRNADPTLHPRAALTVVNAIDAAVTALLASAGLSELQSQLVADILWSRP